MSLTHGTTILTPDKPTINNNHDAFLPGMIASKVFQYQQTLCNRTNGRNFIAIRRFFESTYNTRQSPGPLKISWSSHCMGTVAALLTSQSNKLPFCCIRRCWWKCHIENYFFKVWTVFLPQHFVAESQNRTAGWPVSALLLFSFHFASSLRRWWRRDQEIDTSAVMEGPERESHEIALHLRRSRHRCSLY